ncbi:MAG: 5'-nucleotidase C-terminal domain-containing protein [Treponema sp.]|nr:5'-nucleotidase C-terminal domain-containing protein [Treponema sp.]
MKKIHRILQGLSFALIVLVLFGCASVKPVPYEEGKEYQLVVIHTNDHHGTVLAKDGIAGLAERATYIKAMKAAHENLLILDAGDINTGTAISNMFQAEPDIKAYNMMGYQAVTLGNHEFDGTTEKLLAQMEMSQFPWLSANIVTSKGKPFATPYIIKDYEGFRVGILGLTTLRTQQTASPDKSLTFKDEIQVAQEYVDILKNKELVDVVIVLGHLGSVREAEDQNTSLDLAEAVDGIDLIIDGHSHTKFEEPLYIKDTAIVSANEWGKFMGEGILTIVDGDVMNFNWKPVAITTEAFPPDQEMVDLLQPYVDEANASLQDVVMTTTAPFEFGNRLSRYQETSVGNLTCDAIVHYLQSTGVTVDFAFMNGGGVRAALPAGQVTKEHIMTMLPFENYVYVISIKGSDLIEFFDFVATIPQGAGAFAQVSKEARYTLTYDENKTGTISNLTIGGQPIDPDKTYRMATNDYLASGGDGYTVLTRNFESFNTSMLLSDVVIQYVQTLNQPVEPIIDGRLTVVNGVTP